MVDNFLEEVEERVRSDRYRSMLSRAAPWAIGAVVLLILVLGGLWGWQIYQKGRMNKASETYAAAQEAASAGDSAGSDAKFAEIARSGPPSYKALALMHQAGARIREGKTQEAVALFDQAAKAQGDPLIADNARLKSALALLDTAPYAEMEKRLTPLLDAKRPYRIAAREALAMAKLKAGQTASARTDFVVLSQTLGVPDSMRQRAQAAITLIDAGTAGAIGEVLKAEPVMPAMPPAAGQPGAVQPGAPPAQPGAAR